MHGIFQPRILEQVAISYSRGSSPPRDRTSISYKSPALAGGFLATECTLTFFFFNQNAIWKLLHHLKKNVGRNIIPVGEDDTQQEPTASTADLWRGFLPDDVSLL